MSEENNLEYLKRYVALCDDMLERRVPMYEAHDRLEVLNKEFEGKVDPLLVKTSLVGRQRMEDLEDAWESSSAYC